MESSYTLMSELESPAAQLSTERTEDNATGLRARTKSTPASHSVQNVDYNSSNGVELRRVTITEGTVRSRPKPPKHISSTSNGIKIPVSFSNPIGVTNKDNEVENDEVNAGHIEEAYIIFESEGDVVNKESESQLEEEEDILTPLTSAPDAKLPGGSKNPRGILKRSTPLSLDGSFSSSVTSSEGTIYSQESRRGSKVTFLRGDTTSCAQASTNGSVHPVSENPSLDETDNNRAASPDVNIVGNENGGLLIQRDDEETTRTKPQSIKRRRPPPTRKLQRLQSQLDLDDLSKNELELKANLFFHIGNPIKRWRVERVVPSKLLLQLLKTFCLIVQVVLFTLTLPHDRSQFFYDSRTVFESLFIQNFKRGNREPRDVYTSFTIQDMYSQFEYITRQYYSLPDITIGGYDYTSIDELGNPTPVTMVLKEYKVAELNVINNSYVLDGNIIETTFVVEKGDNVTQVYLNNSQDRFFHSFVSLTVSLPIKNIRIVHPERAECFLFIVMIYYENDNNSGKIHYYLRETHQPESCFGRIETTSSNLEITYGALTVLDVIIIGLCCISIFLTFHSLRRALKLAKAMGTFYQRELEIKLSWWERRSLFPFWHAINTISDLLIITGTLYKIFLTYRVNDLDDANPTRVLLGTAILFQAGVMLRYVSYFKELNALNRTLSLAFPELLKFLLCAFILFIAFALTGWIVLGPFHEKFSCLNSSIESLFGLFNGDDIYNTFILLDPDDDMTAYVYSRLFLYVFLALFIYAVLNLFTSLVITAYDTSQEYDTAYNNEVRRFIFSGPLTPGGVALRDVTKTKKYVDPDVIKLRLKKKRDAPQRRSRASFSWSKSYASDDDESIVMDFAE